MAVAIVLCAGLWFTISTALGKLYYNSFKDYQVTAQTPVEVLKKMRGMAQKAAAADALEGEYRFALANIERRLPQSDGIGALRFYEAAIRRNPCDPDYLQRLASVLAAQGDIETAERLFQSGINRDQNMPAGYRRYARWLLAGGDTPRGLEYLSDALLREPALDKKVFDGYLTTMLRQGLTEAEMLDVLPRQAKAYILFAAYLQQVRQDRMAEGVYAQALTYALQEDPVSASYFYEAYRFFVGQQRWEDALGVMLKAADALPAHAGVRITLGDLYKKLGIDYRAREEYEKALIIAPGNRGARSRLERMKE
jgi:tetratricopeptide (TPR) repeat protein